MLHEVHGSGPVQDLAHYKELFDKVQADLRWKAQAAPARLSHLLPPIVSHTAATAGITSTAAAARVPDQNGVSLIHIMLEIHHSGRQPSCYYPLLLLLLLLYYSYFYYCYYTTAATTAAATATLLLLLLLLLLLRYCCYCCYCYSITCTAAAATAATGSCWTMSRLTCAGKHRLLRLVCLTYCRLL